ncbi:MAG: hypothetical protein NTV86_11640, partial [Planctomycetota bacterium]|nr:hypothetical protein [Planctomycetota bacterium]
GTGNAGQPAELAASRGKAALAEASKDKPEMGLTDALQAKIVELTAAQNAEKTIKSELDSANLKRDELDKLCKSLESAHKTEVTALNDKVTAAGAEVTKVDAKRKTELDQITKEFESRIEKLNADSNRYQTEIEKLKIELSKAKSRTKIVEKLLETYQKARKPRMIYQACGQVVQVKPEDGVVYINLGEKDRVMTGLTFAVHPGEGGMPQVVKDDGTVTESQRLKGKAQLYVLQTFEKVSLCRVEWLANPADPIVKGDLIGNLAFDPVRTFRFAVIGDFDLYSAGRPQEADADHIKFLIRRFRGEVSKDIDEQTDFLIVGTKPVETPALESSEESAQMVKARQEKEKRRADYERISKLAAARDIPILNANEFLALVGYTPQNTLKTFGPTGR